MCGYESEVKLTMIDHILDCKTAPILGSPAGSGESKMPRELLLNEKDMAAHLGISRYFLTELRKKHGLKCLMFEGQHCIYYYLPVVDEYFRSRSRAMSSDMDIQASGTADDDAGVSASGESQSGTENDAAPLQQHRKRYKPMQAV